MSSFWGNIWNVIWLFFWVFAFIAYLIALFNVIGDLFRDGKLNGWWKALWIVFLIFLPFLTVLAYLITRGRGMEERRAAQLQNAQAAANDYIRGVASSSPAEDITKAKALLDSGVIDADEFAKLKAKALS